MRMRARRFRFLTRLLSAVLLLGVSVAPGRAQDAEERPLREQGINYLDLNKPYIEWTAGTLIIIVCLLVMFKNPHRSHLD